MIHSTDGIAFLLLVYKIRQCRSEVVELGRDAVRLRGRFSLEQNSIA